MKVIFSYIVIAVCLPRLGEAQGRLMKFYFDKDKKSIKESYYVNDKNPSVLDGGYSSYFDNGNLKTKGQYSNNKATGKWEFYYESGQLKMEGQLKENANVGTWVYYFENGNKSMEGPVQGLNKEGEWKYYFESGQLKESGSYQANKKIGVWKTFYENGDTHIVTEYSNGKESCTIYYNSGSVKGEGSLTKGMKSGNWKEYYPNGALANEGKYEMDKKIGEWVYYYDNGQISKTGEYRDDIFSGKWNYYNQDGTISATGKFENGQKTGLWNAFSDGGDISSETIYNQGVGTYREYYKSKKLKASGQIVDDLYEGKWQFFSPEGNLEGECDYVKGIGIYKGFYPNGKLQTKGMMEGDKLLGTWEQYSVGGELTGYYKPIYEEREVLDELSRKINKEVTNEAPRPLYKKKGFNYFKRRNPERKGIIVGTNPLFIFLDKLPISFEFYNQDRLGHEFEFVAIRSPFFSSNAKDGEITKRGYSIALRQKFYNKFKIGTWYFGHEIRNRNINYSVNAPNNNIPPSSSTATATEWRFEYGLILGYRMLKGFKTGGLTLDANVGFNIGYRNVQIDESARESFSSLKTNFFYSDFQFGLTFGYCWYFQ